MSESQETPKPEKQKIMPVRKLVESYRENPEQHPETTWRQLISQSLKESAQEIQRKNDWSIIDQFNTEINHEKRRPESARTLQGRSLEILLNPDDMKLSDQLNAWYPQQEK